MKKFLSIIAIAAATCLSARAQQHLDLDAMVGSDADSTTVAAKPTPTTKSKVTIKAEDLQNYKSGTPSTTTDGTTTATLPAPRREVARPRVVKSSDGDTWRTYQVDDMVVALNVRYHSNFGKYFRIDAYVLNESPENKLLNISQASVKSDDGQARLYTQDQYVRRVQNKRFWTAVGIQAATFTTALILDDAFRGGPRGPRGPWVGGYVAGPLLSAGSFLTNAVLFEYYGKSNRDITETSLEYLHNYNIRPNEAVQGFMYAQYAPTADRIIISLPIGERVYSFEWLTSDVKKVR